MPFVGIGKGMYQSPSGRKFTDKQVKLYYATEGFKPELLAKRKKTKRPIRKSKKGKRKSKRVK